MIFWVLKNKRYSYFSVSIIQILCNKKIIDLKKTDERKLTKRLKLLWVTHFLDLRVNGFLFFCSTMEEKRGRKRSQFFCYFIVAASVSSFNFNFQTWFFLDYSHTCHLPILVLFCKDGSLLLSLKFQLSTNNLKMKTSHCFLSPNVVPPPFYLNKPKKGMFQFLVYKDTLKTHWIDSLLY